LWKKDSIKTVSAQFFRLSPYERLAGCVASAMAGLARQGGACSPVLLVDSPFAVQALKQALANSDWPDRDQGAPLPWCGSLEQGFEALVSDMLSDTVSDNGPRSVVVRRVQLAQQLLDHPGLSSSLGGSAKAALDLAAQWVEIFEGWEWLDLGNLSDSSPGFEGQIGSDVQTLRALQKENQQGDDRAFWAQEHTAKRALQGQQEVWFCMGRTPSDLELAIAKTVWGVSDSKIRVFTLELPADLPTPGATRQLISAQSLEEAAWSAAQAILQWRRQGLNDIGVVPLDRKVVRRLRALLDRAGEPFSDRSGWSLDTTVAATALSGLSDLLCGRGTTQSLLEWVHSPFVARALRRQFEFGQAQREALDLALRSYGRIAPVSLSALFTQDLLPQAMQGLLPLCDDKRAALSKWSSRLLSALEICGLEEALANDAAGQSVIAALQILTAQSANNLELVSAPLWQSVLAECLSESRFAEPPSEAAVRVCSLSSLLWRLPQAVLVIGAQAGRLPQPVAPRFFEPKRFAEMGLQVAPEQLQAELFAQFVAAWAAPFPMAMIACSEKPDAEVEFSGWIELLALKAHNAIERVNASDFVARRELALENFSSDISLQARFEGSLPESFSVSSLQSLANCSLQFYWQTLRGLAPTQPLEEEALPSDLGSLLHLVLRGAVHSKASASEWEVWLEKEIDRVLATPFFQKRRDKKLLLPMPTSLRASLRADAMAVVPALAGWLAVSAVTASEISRSREGEARGGPRSIITEHPVSRVLEPLGITIKGQIDRIETGNEGARLIDFKTTNPTELKRRLKTIEDDVQLALYAWMLSPQKIESATYVSIRREGVEDIGVTSSSAETLDQRVEATLALITEKLQAIVNGEPIEAEGVSKHKSICERCLVRGICRRDDLLVPNGEEEESE
jgi:ATP-dependent helicase/nuclease subunit B